MLRWHLPTNRVVGKEGVGSKPKRQKYTAIPNLI